MEMKSFSFKIKSSDKEGSEKVERIYVTLENALAGEDQKIEDIIRGYIPKKVKPEITRSASVNNGKVEEKRDVCYQRVPFFGDDYDVDIQITGLKDNSNRRIELRMSFPKRKGYSVMKDIVNTFEPAMDEGVKASYKMLEDIFDRDPLAP